MSCICACVSVGGFRPSLLMRLLWCACGVLCVLFGAGGCPGLVDMTREVLSEMRVKDAIVVGSDISAVVALKLASDPTCGVRGVVLNKCASQQPSCNTNNTPCPSCSCVLFCILSLCWGGGGCVGNYSVSSVLNLLISHKVLV